MNNVPVEWYRPSPLRRILAVWGVASLLMAVGALSSAVAWESTGRIPDSWQVVAGIIGGIGTIGGALAGLLGILHMLADDPAFLMIREDGIVFQEQENERFIPWQGLAGVRFEGGALVLDAEGQAPLRIQQSFTGISGPQLAKRIIDL